MYLFTENPKCGLTYSIEPGSSSSFAKLNVPNQITIQTSDNSLSQIFDLQLIAISALGGVKAVVDFKVEIIN